MSVTIRHLLPRQGNALPIKLIALLLKSLTIYLQPIEFESIHIVWKTNGLPLTYSCLSNILLILYFNLFFLFISYITD